MSQTPYLYVALGDSITAGYSAPDKRGYVIQLTERLRAWNSSIHALNFSRKGMTSGQMLFLLRHSTAVRHRIRHADLITVYIGGNDLLYTYVKYLIFRDPSVFPATIQTYASNLHQIYLEIRQLTRAPVYAPNLYNPFPRSRFAVTWVTALNRVNADISERWQIPLVNIHNRFLGNELRLIHGIRTGSLHDLRLFGGNPIHPNLLGHRWIAAALWDAIHPPK